jgi:uncharacterized membrane protein (DUF4010 family)
MPFMLTTWPYESTLPRLLLALAIGLFVGVERERRGKKSGVRDFGFASLLGGMGGLLGESYSLLSVSLLGLLVVFLNVQTLMREKRSTELTTSAALLVIGFAGVLCGQGHTLTPAAVAVITVALLAWKEPLAGFSLGLKEAELRSAILLAILALVIYPALPEGTIDPWGVFDPRSVLVTVILIAGLGFANYILLKLYGARGIEFTGFFGGLINSSVAVGELALRVRETQGQMTATAYRGILLAIGAMIVRNAVLLAILAPIALQTAAPTLAIMLIACAALAFGLRNPFAPSTPEETPVLHLESPFSLKSAFRFGAILMAIQIAGVAAQHTFGYIGTYVVSFFGGLFSSASTVAAVADMTTKAHISPTVAGLSVIIASLTSVMVNLPLIMQSHERRLIYRLSWSVGAITLLGMFGAIAQLIMAQAANRL